jgi:alpha-D-ribose 1-methylphosphonate 5-triphosphate synthase subunit PhnL
VRLTVVGRQDCELCDEMLTQLAVLGRTQALPPLTFADVDDHPELAARFFLDIPVLLLGDEVICKHRLDREALLKRLAENGPGAG